MGYAGFSLLINKLAAPGGANGIMNCGGKRSVPSLSPERKFSAKDGARARKSAVAAALCQRSARCSF